MPDKLDIYVLRKKQGLVDHGYQFADKIKWLSRGMKMSWPMAYVRWSFLFPSSDNPWMPCSTQSFFWKQDCVACFMQIEIFNFDKQLWWTTEYA